VVVAATTTAEKQYVVLCLTADNCVCLQLQALVRQLDHGKTFLIPLNSLQELPEKVRKVPARVGAVCCLLAFILH